MQFKLETIWEQFLRIARDEIGTRVVETWFKAIMLNRYDENQNIIYLQAPNVFVRDWVEKHYTNFFSTHLARLFNCKTISVVIRTKSKDEVENVVELINQTENAIPIQYKPAKILKQKNSFVSKHFSDTCTINHNYIFETFVVGPNNSLAYAAAQAVAKELGTLYNPLFIYGESGLGKTHLMHAIGNEILKGRPETSVLYQTADRFVNEFISAIRFNHVHKFQKKYQNIDVLLIDDIQFISNKEQTQEAFFHIFNALYDAHKQIVFTADSYPQNIMGIAHRLRSRLASGLVADIYEPKFETKIAILKKKSAEHNETLSDEVAQYIAMNAGNNIRELQGALIRLLAYASLHKKEISLELAQKVFANVVVQKTTNIEIESIVKALTKYYPFSLKQLRAKDRAKDVVEARQIAIFLIKKLTDKSLRDVGAFFGGRNHATVKHALAKINRLLQKNNDFAVHLHTIENEIMQMSR